MDNFTDKIENKHLAWFLGPKGENSGYFEEILIVILRDYVHWRKNYFPEDDILFSKSYQKEPLFEEQIDSLYQEVYRMMGDLKRNFPFYSPRYMGHMLSDVTMPSMLGYFAGMLFNANNVTSEASPVAAEWEIEASNALVHMIGYIMSPKPPYAKQLHQEKLNKERWSELAKELKSAKYAWGHITSGGTIANIEALWVARNVKYLALGLLEAYLQIKRCKRSYKTKNLHALLVIKEIAEFEKINNEITDFNEWTSNPILREKAELEILNIKTDDAVGLLQTFYNNISFANEQDIVKVLEKKITKGIYEYKATNGIMEKAENSSIEQDEKMYLTEMINKLLSEMKIGAGLELLSETQYHNDLPGLMSKYSPIIYAPCTAHYSVKKAADLLGIPRSNVKKLKVDASFRMDIQDLENNLNRNLSHNKAELKRESADGYKQRHGKYIIPLAVIGVCGTTEEGAVDPIHKIVQKRKEFESKHKVSFWIHADAAYGGFFCSLLHVDAKDILKFRKKHFVYHLKKVLHEFCKKRVIKNNNKGNLVENIELNEKEKFRDSESILENILDDNKIDNALIINEEDNILCVISTWYLQKFDDINYKVHIKTLLEILEMERNGDFDNALEKLIIFIVNNFSNELDKLPKYNYTENHILFYFLRYKIKGEYDKNEFNPDNPHINSEEWCSEVIDSFQALAKVNSVTIDPHKMGYVQYPCGFIGFKSDKVRNYIKQGAPYITSSGSSELNPQPPRHLEDFNMGRLKNGDFPYTNEKKYKVAIDAFAPYILEGSKPAAAAASLWLTTNLIKPNFNDYGQIIINSIRAANELYNGIKNWEEFKSATLRSEARSVEYNIINLTIGPPDTNVIVFFIKPFIVTEPSRKISLENINNATLHVYNKFHISAEHGDRKTSYNQEFFISKTQMYSDTYSESCLEHHIGEGKVFNYPGFSDDYKGDRLEILRMAIMNPYIYPYKKQKGLNLVDKFLKEIDEAMKTFRFDTTEDISTLTHPQNKEDDRSL